MRREMGTGWGMFNITPAQPDLHGIQGQQVFPLGLRVHSPRNQIWLRFCLYTRPRVRLVARFRFGCSVVVGLRL